MKAVNILAVLFFSLVIPCWGTGTVVSDCQRMTELWEGRALTAQFRVGMCYDRRGNARGVLLLRHATGQEDQYHLYGTLKNNEFDLRHSSGHHLFGTLDDGTMKGKAKLKNGISMSLTGKRTLNAPVAAPDCAPLPKY